MVATNGTNAELRMAEDEFGSIIADSDRLRQLLEIILANAMMRGGSDVTVYVKLRRDGFAIEDDGPGILPPLREKVFDHGFSTAETGTGFGLQIVKRIVDAHD